MNASLQKSEVLQSILLLTVHNVYVQHLLRQNISWKFTIHFSVKCLEIETSPFHVLRHVVIKSLHKKNVTVLSIGILTPFRRIPKLKLTEKKNPNHFVWKCLIKTFSTILLKYGYQWHFPSFLSTLIKYKSSLLHTYVAIITYELNSRIR